MLIGIHRGHFDELSPASPCAVEPVPSGTERRAPGEKRAMTEPDGDTSQTGAESPGKRADARRSKTIRFSDPEWELVERAATKQGIPAAEYVRNAAMGAAQGKIAALNAAMVETIRQTDLPQHLYRRNAQARRNASGGTRRRDRTNGRSSQRIPGITGRRDSQIRSARPTTNPRQGSRT